jgi:hypothetical protein
MGKVQEGIDEASITRSYAERVPHIMIRVPPRICSHNKQREDWKQRFTQGSLLLTGMVLRADRFVLLSSATTEEHLHAYNMQKHVLYNSVITLEGRLVPCWSYVCGGRWRDGSMIVYVLQSRRRAWWASKILTAFPPTHCESSIVKTSDIDL